MCGTHGGRAPQVRASAAARVVRAEVEADCRRLGVPVEVDQGEALLRLIYEANGNVAYYRARLAELDEVYAAIFHATGERTGEARPHVLVVMYDAERDRLANLCALALRAGVEERRVRLAEVGMAASVEVLFAAVGVALAAVGLAAGAQAEFRRVLAAEVRRREVDAALGVGV